MYKVEQSVLDSWAPGFRCYVLSAMAAQNSTEVGLRMMETFLCQVFGNTIINK